MTNEEILCLYDNMDEKNYIDIKKKLYCSEMKNISDMNDMHIKVNNVLNKYISTLVKLRKRMLNLQIYVINKDCTNIINKKNKFQNLVNEYNKSMKRMFQLLYIYSNEEKELLKLIQ